MDRYRIKPGTKINLKDWDPDETSEFKGDKAKVEPRLLELTKELESLQGLLYAEHKHKVLIVLQAMDTGGKDGVISHVFEGVNPQGVRVASFKIPTPEESDHDYLWRIHQQTPGKGEIVIFNRSHYEDVLVVRVHNLVAPEVWGARFDQINHWEQQLTAEGTIILKFYLHISLDMQKARLLDRLNDPVKNWKFSPFDLKERALWSDYMQAYTDVLSKTSTDYSPWYLVPANHKWYRNLVIATVLVQTLKDLNMQFPPAVENIEQYRVQLK